MPALTLSPPAAAAPRPPRPAPDAVPALEPGWARDWDPRPPAPATPAEVLADAGVRHRLTEAYAARRGLSADALAAQLADVRAPGPPERLPGFAEAQALLRACVPAQGRARVHVHADPDADGCCAALLLREAVLARNPGADVSVTVAPRLRGRWLDARAAERLPPDLDLLVLADQRPHALPDHQRTLAVDHHALPPAPLAVETLFNPHTHGPDAPGGELSAAGLAWHLARAAGAPAARLAPLAAVGVIGDCAPMRGDVRALARMAQDQVRGYGYKEQDPRLRALLAGTRATYKWFDGADTCAYYLAPKLNAALRQEAPAARDWLLAPDWPTAQRAGMAMGELHARQRDRLAVAEAQLNLQLGAPEATAAAPLVRVVHFRDLAGFHGVVANRIAARHDCLAVVGDGVRYSARRPDSLAGIDLAAWLELPVLREGLGARGGGHAGACGFMLAEPRSPQAIAQFLGLLIAAHGVRRQPPDLLPARLAELTPEAVGALRALGPFGRGWPKPRLLVEVLLDRDGTRTLGQPALHVQYGMRDPAGGGAAWRGLFFNAKADGDPIPLADALLAGPVRALALCELDDRDDRTLIVRALEPADPALAEALAPPRLGGLA